MPPVNLQCPKMRSGPHLELLYMYRSSDDRHMCFQVCIELLDVNVGTNGAIFTSTAFRRTSTRHSTSVSLRDEPVDVVMLLTNPRKAVAQNFHTDSH